MVKRSTMASSSPKPSKRYSLRSISLPARSHPSTLRVEEQLNKIKSWEASTSSSKRVETICLGLSLLGELYRCIDDLLNLPLTQQALAPQKHQKWVNDLLEGSLGYLDVCGKTRDAILSMQEAIRELQSALRRKRAGDLSVESIVTSYTCSRRLMKKEIAKSLASLKPIDNQFGDLPMSDQDDPLPAVVRVLAETNLSTISIFHSLLLFLSVPVFKPKPSSSRWSLVFKQLQKGVLAGKDQQAGNMNELERVDTAVGNLLMHNSSQDMEAQKIQSAQIRLGALDVSMEGLEKGLECLFRRLIQARVLILNIISN
ncbi:hypothetical protein I3760_08G170300 [Carya illinoinensis]|uniref:Uncharacterized protein n=1 Tax=Carya illinoinensis TaxID=32201 RepID=A0A8T1PP50_CARIL|nr:uncharacterized protein LOC122318319 [Carya illinoinensis]KAG2694995.1 hypothetical protein I3760_08G170300 [Carya illinoinensis]KAG6646239.1 hypothetical protein CIPAW_08G180100 [Carya illinoinensis]